MAVIGVGGLGCPVVLYLAAAGVGHIGLFDGDTVEASNLHRQVLHTTKWVGRSKVSSAQHHLNKRNPHVAVTAVEQRIGIDHLQLLEGYGLVIDCTDNSPTRYLLSDYCVLTHKVAFFLLSPSSALPLTARR